MKPKIKGPAGGNGEAKRNRQLGKAVQQTPNTEFKTRAQARPEPFVRLDVGGCWRAVYRDGERLGEVRRAFGAFVARTRLGAPLGDFITMDAAVAAIERGVAS
jgi:hypothetical protein